jgi:hypothetical protein
MIDARQGIKDRLAEHEKGDIAAGVRAASSASHQNTSPA